MLKIEQIKSLFWETPKTWTYAGLEPKQTPNNKQLLIDKIEPDNYYLNIFIRSMRISKARILAKKFYAVATSSISLPIIDQLNKANFNVATSLAGLKNVKAKDKIIQMNHRILGPIPYRGGDLDIEIGLFAVESSNIVSPYINMLEGLSAAAGVSIVQQALPFVNLISKGIYSLLGAGEKNNLVVGIRNTYDTPTTGNFVVIAGPDPGKAKIKLKNIKLDEQYRLLNKNGDQYQDYPYIVFSIYTTKTRQTWFNIKKLADAYKKLIDATGVKPAEEVTKIFGDFKRALYLSPDILPEDAEQTAKKVYRQKVAPMI